MTSSSPSVSPSYANVASKPPLSDPIPEKKMPPSLSSLSSSSRKDPKLLAPAPVPLQLAWGVSAAPANPVSPPVDEHKWPTPDQGPLVADAPKPQRFIRPVTTKWLPIEAKVVLPSPPRLLAPKLQRNNRKQKPSNSMHNNPSAQPLADSAAASDPQPAEKGPSPNGELSVAAATASASATPTAAPAASSSIPAAASAESSLAKHTPTTSANANPSSASRLGPRRQQGQPFQKRFPSASGSGAGPSANQHHAQPFQQGYYPHQQFVQPFQAFPGRPFRPQNGQFRPNGGRGRSNNAHFRPGPPHAHPHAMMGPPHLMHMGPPPLYAHEPMPDRIPPPISPKQEPREAFVAQIDYYFSMDNLIRDVYLRKMMDPNGWVGLLLILNFKRVQIILNGIQNLIDAPDKEAAVTAIVLGAVKDFSNVQVRYANGKDAASATVDDILLRVKENHQQWLLPAENSA